MQTFLPYPDYYKSALVLDMKRLQKQIAEGTQIMKAMHGFYRKPDKPDRPGAWENHPATVMWRNCPEGLFQYLKIVHRMWMARSLHRTTPHKSYVELYELFRHLDRPWRVCPWWICDPEVFRSHRANLTRKDPEYYSQFWDEDPTLPYKWPSS